MGIAGMTFQQIVGYLSIVNDDAAKSLIASGDAKMVARGLMYKAKQSGKLLSGEDT